MSAVERVRDFPAHAVERVRDLPAHAVEFANVLLTTEDAAVGVTPQEVVWTHRQTTLYRYRSSGRVHAVPILLVFALINRPQIFDLRPGSSFVEFLLDEGFDVFLVDWGTPDEEDLDMGLEEYVCDELDWAIRETLRASGAEELTLLGWCIGATLCAMYCGLEGAKPSHVRNLVLLTMPIDGRDSRYGRWLGDASFDADRLAELWRVVPGWEIDFANKMLKPVTNFLTTYRKLWENVEGGSVRRDAYQTMAKWIADNPPFAGRAWAQWVRLMYRDGSLAEGRLRLRGRRVDLCNIDQSVLVVSAGADHIAPRPGTIPFFEAISSRDVTDMERPGGHIGLMAGSGARKQTWPEIASWLAERSDGSQK